MVVGGLGRLTFYVSSDKIETVTNFKSSLSAKFGKHQRHSGGTLVEYIGNDAETISFDIVLSASLGVDVEAELDKIREMQRNGEAGQLVIGKRRVGEYRWVIEKSSVTYKYYDKEGRVAHAEVSLSLLEYLKWK